MSSTSATFDDMGTIGLRALRQDASEVVRRVEGGEEIDITVSGRVVARMVPVGPKTWRTWDEVAHIFTGRQDPDWERDRDLIDQSIEDPWERNK